MITSNTVIVLAGAIYRLIWGGSKTARTKADNYSKQKLLSFDWKKPNGNGDFPKFSRNNSYPFEDTR